MARPSLERQTDAYEQKHMGHDEGLLYRAKVPRPRWWNSLFLGMTAFLASANLYDPVNGWHALAVGMPPLIAAWALLPVLRIAVTKKNVRIQMGVFGPTIPVEQIVSCQLIDAVRGSGSPRGFIYNVGGDKRRVIEIGWQKSAGGRATTTLVSVADPEEMLEAIERARAPLRALPDADGERVPATVTPADARTTP